MSSDSPQMNGDAWLKQPPTTLDDAYSAIEAIRASLLFEYDSKGPMCPFEEQEFLVSLGHLDLAMRHMKMAEYNHMRNL